MDGKPGGAGLADRSAPAPRRPIVNVPVDAIARIDCRTARAPWRTVSERGKSMIYEPLRIEAAAHGRTPAGAILEGKTAIVTGAGSGIGRGVALLFARQGANVIVADLDRDAGEGTA